MNKVMFYTASFFPVIKYVSVRVKI